MLTAFIIDLHINIIICLSIQLTKVNLFASPNYEDTSFDAHGVKK